MSVATLAPQKRNWVVMAVVGGIHLAALAAFVPWLFSWTGVVLAVGGCYVFGTLGINLGFHRLLTHRSFKCSLWLEHVLAVLGICCLENTPGQFVATHRAHHQHEDDEEDPHSPLVTLFWGHMGWLFVENPQLYNAGTYDRYARDVFRDPFYLGMERNFRWLWVYGIHACCFTSRALPSATWSPADLCSPACNSAPACWSGARWCAPCWCGTLPGASTRSATCGATAPTRRAATHATM